MQLPQAPPDFGVLTAVRPDKKEIIQSIGLALSLELKIPGIPRAIICAKKRLDAGTLSVLQDLYAHIIDERPDLSGWHHKLHLDEYTPFQKTLFLDSDMLVVRDIVPWVTRFCDSGFPYWGIDLEKGKLWEGPLIEKILSNIGRKKLPCMRGGGHYYLEKGSSLFAAAREVARPEVYRKLIGNFIFTDETAVMVAAALENRSIETSRNVFVMTMDPLIRKAGIKLDCISSKFEVMSNGYSSSVTWQRPAWMPDNEKLSPAIAHFSGDRDNWIYHMALGKLFSHFSGLRLPALPNGVSAFMTHIGRLSHNYISRKILKLQFKEMK